MTTLLKRSDVVFDLSTECVIVGAGACGLVAALALADNGIEALVLERDAKPTGSTSMSSGFIPAAGTAAQLSQGIEDSPEVFSKDIQHKAESQSDPILVQAVTESIAPTLDWLADKHKLKWIVLDDFLYPGHSRHRMHAVPEKTGAAFLEYLLRAAASSNIDIATHAHVDALIATTDADDQKSICGVRVQRPDGTAEHIEASSVILACNGYGANPELMQRFVPHMARAYYHGHAGNTGDAMLWGEQLGVPLLQTGAYQGHGSVAAGHHILITWALMMEGGVQINQDGYRFSNEQAGYSEQAEHVIKQPFEAVWSIYDQRLHKLGLTFPDYCEANNAGAVNSAENVEELAAITGMPLEALQQTLTDINTLAIHNGTDNFGRTFDESKFLHAPYYAIKVIPAIFHTQGGLAINNRAAVLHSSGKPVANLYAAGGAAVGVSGSTVSGYLSGNGLLTAVGLAAVAACSVAASRGVSGIIPALPEQTDNYY